MNENSSALVVHCGARKVTRDELKELPVPEGTKTHQPLSHYEIVDVLEEALSFRYLKIERDEYAVSQDGMKMFGVMDLNFGFTGCRFSIGLRNSNDKSMRLALTAGYRVFVCDNMAFSGDFTPLFHKHTRNLELRDSISIAVDRIHRGFSSTESRVKSMKGFGLTDNDARLFIYRAFMERAIRGATRNLMSVVHDHYFNPVHEAFVPRNLWALSNAFTSAFKKLAPMSQFEATARLGSFLSELQDAANPRPEEAVESLDEHNALHYGRPAIQFQDTNGGSPGNLPEANDDSKEPVPIEGTRKERAPDDPEDSDSQQNAEPEVFYDEYEEYLDDQSNEEEAHDNINEIMEEFERKIAA